MSIVDSRRRFKLWDASPSFGSIVILRSPKDNLNSTSLEIVFFSVAYIQIHTFFNGLTVRQLTGAHTLTQVECITEQNTVFQLSETNNLERPLTGFIVANVCKLYETDLDIDKSALDGKFLGF